VSGIGPHIAKNIVSFRTNHGPFASRDALHKVNGLGAKTFQQAAGFLRIPESSNVLDNSAVHPESYAVVERMARDLNVPVSQLIGNRETVETIPLENYVSETFGMPTLKDIVAELIKPGRDPRAEGTRLVFSDDISTIADLKVGMKLKGTVSNVTNCGAFVDIGVHQDGLIHISELSNQFVDDPSRVIRVGDVIDVYVIGVDLQRNRISLSRKAAQGERRQPQAPREQRDERRPARNDQRPAAAGATGPRREQQQQPNRSNPQGQRAAKGAPAAPSKKFTMDDLLSKFNVRN
jgi:protein Tex